MYLIMPDIFTPNVFTDRCYVIGGLFFFLLIEHLVPEIRIGEKDDDECMCENTLQQFIAAFTPLDGHIHSISCKLLSEVQQGCHILYNRVLP